MKDRTLRPVLYDAGGDVVCLLDQRKLPLAEIWVELHSADEVAEAIQNLTVRGAPAIGVAAAYALACEARRGAQPDRLREAAEHLVAARPTAVNLAWAVRRMSAFFEEGSARLLTEAERIREEDEAACRKMGALGAALLPADAKVLTHCNAGALATAGYGSALGVVRAAVEAGKKGLVFADETRPFFQGARLTTWELHRDQIPVTLITDNAAGWLMSRGEVNCVVVGADRVAANGDAANKIGTYSVAVLARHHRIPLYVVCPWSTVDLATASGDDIPIEERSGDEVKRIGDTVIAPEEVPARYPAFDVTPAALITAIVTERGVAQSPFPQSLAALAPRP